MSVTEHFIKGKTVVTGVTPDGFVFTANVKDLTLVEDDNYDDSVWELGDYSRYRDTTWSIKGEMVPINDRGTIYEVRRG